MDDQQHPPAQQPNASHPAPKLNYDGPVLMPQACSIKPAVSQTGATTALHATGWPWPAEGVLRA